MRQQAPPQGQDDIGAGERQAAAAALGLERPVEHLSAQLGHQTVHRPADSPGCRAGRSRAAAPTGSRNSRRPSDPASGRATAASMAASISSLPKACKRPRTSTEAVTPCCAGWPASARTSSTAWRLAGSSELVLSDPHAVEAHDTGSQQGTAGRGRQAQVAGGQGQGQQLVGAVCGRRSAATPIRDSCSSTPSLPATRRSEWSYSLAVPWSEQPG